MITGDPQAHVDLLQAAVADSCALPCLGAAATTVKVEPRGRGGGPPRGGRGGAVTMARGRGGARGAPRGSGGMGRARGAGGRGGAPPGGPRGGAGAGAAAKRKIGGADSNPALAKKRNTAGTDTWGAQPIAQQPLGSGGASGGYDSQWYQDSYGGGQQWA